MCLQFRKRLLTDYKKFDEGRFEINILNVLARTVMRLFLGSKNIYQSWLSAVGRHPGGNTPMISADTFLFMVMVHVVNESMLASEMLHADDVDMMRVTTEGLKSRLRKMKDFESKG